MQLLRSEPYGEIWQSSALSLLASQPHMHNFQLDAPQSNQEWELCLTQKVMSSSYSTPTDPILANCTMRGALTALLALKLDGSVLCFLNNFVWLITDFSVSLYVHNVCMCVIFSTMIGDVQRLIKMQKNTNQVFHPRGFASYYEQYHTLQEVRTS